MYSVHHCSLQEGPAYYSRLHCTTVVYTTPLWSTLHHCGVHYITTKEESVMVKSYGKKTVGKKVPITWLGPPRESLQKKAAAGAKT